MYVKTTLFTDLDVPGHEAWRVLKDFGGHYQFNPLIELSPIINGISEGPGAEREVLMYDGSVIRQVILDYVEGELLLIGFTESTLPIKHATAAFRVDPPDQDYCRVSVEVTLQPKYGVLGAALGFLLKPTVRNRYNLVLRGLKHFVQTGEPLGPDGH